MQAVIDTLKAAGVADEDVQTTDLSMYPEYDRHKKGQPQTLRGYRVSQSVSSRSRTSTRPAGSSPPH